MPSKIYRVQKVTPEGDLVEEQTVTASSPEEAAGALFDCQLSRGQKGYRGILRAKVYVPGSGNTPVTLVRLYQREPMQGAEA